VTPGAPGSPGRDAVVREVLRRRLQAEQLAMSTAQRDAIGLAQIRDALDLRGLGVGPKQVVQSGDWCCSADGLVSAAMVVVPEPAVKGGGPFVA